MSCGPCSRPSANRHPVITSDGDAEPAAGGAAQLEHEADLEGESRLNNQERCLATPSANVSAPEPPTSGIVHYAWRTARVWCAAGQPVRALPQLGPYQVRLCPPYPMEAKMRNLTVIAGAALLMSMAGCAYSNRTYYDPGYAYSNGNYYGRPVAYHYEERPYAYPYPRYYNYDYRYYGYDGRSNGHG